MARRKYESYNLVADYGQVNEDYENYKEAYHEYCKQIQFGNPATLYGLTFEGGISVIFSHA